MFSAVLFFSLAAALAVVTAYFLYSWIAWNYSEQLDVPFIPTPFYALRLICEKLAIRKGDIVYDIGCGDGRVLFYCAKRHPDAKFVGIEINPHLVFWMRLRKFLTRAKNVEIRCENIYSSDLSDATKIYAFLLQDITDKFFSNGKYAGVRVVTRAFRIRRLTPLETFRVTPHDVHYGGHLAYVYEL